MIHKHAPYFVALLAALALPACSSSEDDPLTQDLDQLSEHIAALQQDVNAHAREVAAAPDMAAVIAAEDAHQKMVHEHMSGMHGMMGDMHDCMNADDQAPSMGMMEDMLDSMDHECDGHDATMRGETDLGAARAEEERHHQGMGEMLESMGTEIARMKGDEMKMGDDGHMCSGGMHGG